MSFAFANKLGEKVSKSYNNPYDAYQNRKFYEVCLVVDNHVLNILDTKMITVKWAILCAKQVLHIFEEKYPDDQRPRKAIEAASNWIRDPSEKNRMVCKDAYEAAYAAYTANDYDNFYAAAYASYAVYGSSYSLHVISNTSNASNVSPNKSLEIRWQCKKLNQIVYEEVILLLVKSQYHRINNKLVRKIPKELLEYIGSFIIG